ncbi:dihydrolipoyl dehydrogenase family protein [Ilumatobacter sp.]|uniref:dihydrolipoyl dehydrogenase family protein n=1 Tax=Ilumatobacter sp. TaxID=1967498 RepID=UPI003B52219E
MSGDDATLVIGAGSGGLTVAIGLSRLGRDVVLVEEGPVGGDCTNVGCVPSKSLLHAAAAGLDDPFSHVRAKRDRLAVEEEREIVEDERIELVHGRARLTGRRDPHVVEVTAADGTVTERRAANVVICTGSAPVELAIDGLDPSKVVTNETLFELTSVPSTILLIGGGPISLEMATAFHDLGSAVHLVEAADRLLAQEDPIVSDAIRRALDEMGVIVHTGTVVDRFDGDVAHLADSRTVRGVDTVLVAIGRRPVLEGLGLEGAGVTTSERGIEADSWGRTSVDGIWAVGDVTGSTATTHGAMSIARRCLRAIALPLPTLGDPRAQPAVVYSRPQVASVGMSVEEVEAFPATARRRHTVQIPDIDRGYTDDVSVGLVVVDVERFTGRILRAAIVGPAAAEIIGILTLAIDRGIGLRKLFGMVHPYPSYAMAIGELADEFSMATFESIPREWWAMVRGRVASRRRR